jgi:hypothetical protein
MQEGTKVAVVRMELVEVESEAVRGVHYTPSSLKGLE